MVAGSSTSAALTKNDFTVGWICALSIERAASEQLFDDEYDDPQLVLAPDDSDVYSYGRIGQHNVVIACLPEGTTGTNAAATTATNLIRSFPQIRFGLMVGIGGAAPGSPNTSEPEKDIRLGDVVVSCPQGGEGGVIQYDFGKTIENGRFIKTGHCNKPSSLLRSAVSKLNSRHQRKSSRIADYLKEIQENKMMRKKFSCPGPENDRLFRADYSHVEKHEDCMNCDSGQLVQRVPREESNPVIHYGLIGSANQVMRDAVRRDQLRDEMGVCCFEMEAAGLMDSFPCLVIRGLCDYADTHKCKRWQPYAAAVAASYAKELLGIIPPTQVAQAPTAENAIAEFSGKMNQMAARLSSVATDIGYVKTSQNHGDRAKVYSWLSPIDHHKFLHDVLHVRQPRTGLWFLRHSNFLQWMTQDRQILRCPGIPGAGKTMMASITIDYLTTTKPGNEAAVAFFYCNYKRQDSDTVNDVLESILAQLLAKLPVLPGTFQDLFDRHCRGEKPKLCLQEVRDELSSLMKRFSCIYIVVDALDEFGVSRDKLLEELTRLQQLHDIRLLLTFRPETRVDCKCPGPTLEIRAQDEDIRQYLDGNESLLPRVAQRDLLQQEIKDRILDCVDGMFLLARLHLKALQDKLTVNQVRDYLASMKKGSDGLQQTYDAAVSRITGQAQGCASLAREVLFWILHAKRHLTTIELRHALAVKMGTRELDMNDLYELDDLVSWCAGLVTVDTESNEIRLVHHTTEAYLKSDEGKRFLDSPTDMAMICLTYLSFDVFNQGCCATDEMLATRQANHPFLSYAARNWGRHMPDSQGCDLALQFLEDGPKTANAGQVLFAGARVSRRDNKPPTRHMCGAHLAAYFGLQELMPMLVKKVDPDAQDSNSRTPLSYAAEEGHASVVQLLLKCGVEPDSKSTMDMTPLAYASEEGHVRIVQLLLAENVEVNYTYPFEANSCRTLLSRAAERGYCDVTRILLDNHADIDLPDQDGHTPLVRAIEAGHSGTFELLLGRNARTDYAFTLFRRTRVLNSQDGSVQYKFGLLPELFNDSSRILELTHILLDGAVEGLPKFGHGTSPEHGSQECEVFAEDIQSPFNVQVCREGETHSPTRLADAETSDVQEVQRTPLSRAAEMGNARMVEALLSRGSRPDLVDENDYDSLRCAVQNGHEKVVRVLLQYGVIPRTKESQEDLFQAALRGLEVIATQAGTSEESCSMEPKIIMFGEIIECLLEKGLGLRSSQFCRPKMLILAAYHGLVPLLNHLLDIGVDPNYRLETGVTSLIASISKGQDRVLRILLKGGADPDLLDRQGRSPLMIAVASGDETIVQSLLEGGSRLDIRHDNTTAFGYAVIYGHANIVNLLLSHIGDPDSMETSRNESPLTIAVSQGFHVVAQLLLSCNANPNFEHNDSIHSPLEGAVVAGSLKMIQLLLEKGADPNAKESLRSLSPVLAAAFKGNRPALHLLLQHGADMNYENGRRPPVLFVAIQFGNEMAVDLLLEAGADPNSKSSSVSYVPLSAAAEKGNQSMVYNLSHYGADPDYHDSTRPPPLIRAVGQDDELAVRLLLGIGADPDCKNWDNLVTPLACAAYMGNGSMVKMLLENKADLNHGRSCRTRPLAVAVAEGKEDVAQILLEHSAHLTRENLCCPLFVAAELGNETLVMDLLEAGADPNYIDDETGSSPLEAAVSNKHEPAATVLLAMGADPIPGFVRAAQLGHAGLVQIHLDLGADPDAPDKDGRRPLYLASARGHGAVVQLLSTQGVDPNAKDHLGRTALMAAAAGAYVEPVRTLLGMDGIDREVQDSFGRTALSCAVEAGSDDIIRLLQEAPDLAQESQDEMSGRNSEEERKIKRARREP